jgi:iron complex outermembrane receptor protein
VWSGFFEINAPIFNQLEINASGRYDSYSSGQKNFSPKIGAKFTPIRQVAFRSTFSKGFRIPSFAEAYGQPTTGYVTVTPPASYLARCTAAAGTYCINSYSLGLTSVGNPTLRPEKATNFTLGVIIEPVRNISLSIDYYNIYKKDLITGADYGPQVAAYYAGATAGTTLTNGITGITQDVSGYGLLPAGAAPYPLLATVEYGFINANSAKSTGIDFDLEGSFHLTPKIKWITSFEANYIIELSTTINGVKQVYQDSLGPYQTTSASGTPRWRGSWQNTLEFGPASLTATAYYTAGYSEGAADDGNTPNGQVCATTGGSYGSFARFLDNPNPLTGASSATIANCRVKHFVDVDLTGSVKIAPHFTLYGNVLNLFNAAAPYDASTYGGSNYNPAWANAGLIGRYFRFGAKVDF